VSAGWLDIGGPEGPRRAALRAGLTRVGGGAAEVPLAGVSSDQLHFYSQPARVRFEGRGAPPSVAGLDFIERALRPGDRLEWAGYTLVFGGEAEASQLASLEELEVPHEIVAPSPTVTAPLEDAATRMARRARAGIACELGLAERGAVQRWQKAVLQGNFEPDACARELLAAPPTSEGEERLAERAGSLLRDFLMASYLSGSKGAGRKLRGGMRNLAGFLLAQLVALVVFSAIVLAILLVLRVKGESLDALLDRVISWVP